MNTTTQKEEVNFGIVREITSGRYHRIYSGHVQSSKLNLPQPESIAHSEQVRTTIQGGSYRRRWRAPMLRCLSSIVEYGTVQTQTKQHRSSLSDDDHRQLI